MSLIKSLVLPVLGLLVAAGAWTSVPAADCGCDQPANCGCNAKVTVQVCERPACYRKYHCLHHHCNSCCQSPQQSAPRAAAPPAGPVYESMGMARAMPMMAMPMMMASYPVATRAVSYEEAPLPRQARETTCSSSASEIELLKERFDRLHTRVNTLQDSMEVQTQILKKITDKLDDLDKKVSK